MAVELAPELRQGLVRDVGQILWLGPRHGPGGFDHEDSVAGPVEDFLEYGRWFQERVAADVDRRMVSDVRASNGGFSVSLEDGECLETSRVVVAAGIAGFPNIPPELTPLLPRLASHTSTKKRNVEYYKAASTVDSSTVKQPWPH